MSTYYYVCCDQCQQRLPLWTNNGALMADVKESPALLTKFFAIHCPHGVVVTSEHDDRRMAYTDETNGWDQDLPQDTR